MSLTANHLQLGRGLRHFVITRLGLCVYCEQELSDALDLFEAVTLPSLMNQIDQGFTCLVVVDAHMPNSMLSRLAGLLSPDARFALVTVDVTRLVQVRQGCFDWIWEACQDQLLQSRVVTNPDEYVVTSILDADDAWHEEVVRTVNRHMSERLEQLDVTEGDRGTWLQHTQGIAATFERGYAWFIAGDTWQKIQQPFMSMAVFVLARFSSGVSACSSRHLAWPEYCSVVAFERLTIQQKEPMWVWVRHAGSTQPWIESRKSAFGVPMSSARCRSFGLDPHRVAQWRRRYLDRVGHDSPRTYPGRSASDQFDRVFKIAGLNRQIEALLAHRVSPGLHSLSEIGAIDDIVAQAQAKRNALVHLLRSPCRKPSSASD